MGLAAAVQGARRPAQVITWTDADGTAVNLTGATITGIIRNRATGAARAVDGTLTVTTPAAGVFTWAYGTTDVGTAGLFDVQFNAAFGSAPTPARNITASWIVHEALTV